MSLRATPPSPMVGVNGQGEDNGVPAITHMAYQILQFLVGDIVSMGRTAVDHADYLPIYFSNIKPVWINLYALFEEIAGGHLKLIVTEFFKSITP